MGKIPEFTRTVLPQTAQYGLVDAARTAGEAKAGQLRYDASITESNRHMGNEITSQLNQIKLREAEATNTTWVNENVIAYKRDLADQQDAQRQARAGNPNNFHKDFDKDAEKIAADYVKAAPSEAARIALKQTASGIRASAYEENLGWEKQRKVEQFGESMDRTAGNLGALAYRAGQDGTDLEKSGLFNDVAASTVAGSTFIAPDKLEGLSRTMKKNVVSNYMEGLFDKNPAAAKTLLNSKKYDSILGADEIERFDSKIKAQERIEIGDDVSDIETAAKMGIEVPKDKITSVIGKLEDAGMQEQARRLRDYADIQDTVVAFAKKPMAQQATDLAAMKTSVQGGNLDDIKKYAAMAEVLQTKQEAIQKDPWSFYGARNVVREPQAIDFANPQSMAKELDQRRIAVQQVKDLDGVTIPLFNGAEIASLKQVYETAQPRQMSALLGSISTALKPTEASALAKAMAPTSKTLAVAIAVGDPQVGERILEGANAKGEVEEADVRDAVNSKLGGAIIDPGKLEPIQEAIYANYKQLSLMAGDNKKSVDSKRLDRAVDDILGPVVSIDAYSGWGGNSKVLSYKDSQTGAWTQEDRLNDILGGITDDILVKTNGQLPQSPAGGNWTAEKIKKSARFVTAGDGQYTAIVDGLGFVSDKSGNPYIFDARKIGQYVVPQYNQIVLPGGEVVQGSQK